MSKTVMPGQIEPTQTPLKELEDEIVGVIRGRCYNGFAHNIAVIRYRDGSIWVACPQFTRNREKLVCKRTQRRCRYFKAI